MAHNEVFLTTYRPTGQMSNPCSVRRVLERENTKWRLGAVPKAYLCNWTENVRVKDKNRDERTLRLV